MACGQTVSCANRGSVPVCSTHLSSTCSCSGGAEMPLQYGQGLPNPQMQTQMAGGPNPAYPANPGMSSQHHSPLRPENEPHAGLGSKPGQSGLSAGRGNVMSGGMGHQYSQQPSHQLFPGNGMASQRPHPMAKGVMSSVQGMPGQPGSRYPGIHQQALVGMASLSNSRQLGGPTLRSTY